MTRERTFEWDQPIPMRERGAQLSGLELLQRAIAGEYPPPPIAKLMDIRLTEVEKGKAIFTGTPQEFHYNPLGTVHGGYGATLLDSAMGCAVHSTLDAGDIYTTLEFKINFMRALTHETGEVRGIGTVINATRTTAVAEGRIVDASGKIYAFATTTCVIRRAGTA
ncbi:MAG TPA: PaaI family thioesterase [Vicinamibacterales bacterium]|nr:PaaI family thioesterase [Vicinamibacterales bacterium]